MKAKVVIEFHDLKADVIREVGEVFECTEERFNEIEAIIPGHIAKVEPPKRSTKKPA